MLLHGEEKLPRCTSDVVNAILQIISICLSAPIYKKAKG